MSTDGREETPSPAVGRAIRILEYLAHVQPEASLSDIAAALELNKSTCFNILKALTQSGIVVRDARFPIYRLGPKLIELGTASRRNYSYRALVKREVAPLVERYQLACLLAQLLPNDAGIVITDRIMPSRTDVMTAPIGQVYPLSVPAMGRAVLADRPFSEVVKLADVLSLTEGDALQRLQEDLAQFRKLGYGTSLEEYQPGINAVAVTVSGPDGDLALILCLLGPADEFPAESVAEAGVALREVAAKLESALHQTSSAFSLEGVAEGPSWA
jgi:IclR family acetate operon transcriptional repressor